MDNELMNDLATALDDIATVSDEWANAAFREDQEVLDELLPSITPFCEAAIKAAAALQEAN